MLINIDAPLKRQEIMDLLQAQTKPHFEFKGHPMNMATRLQFEVTDYEEVGDVVGYVKKLIKSQPYGSGIALRVLEDGKAW